MAKWALSAKQMPGITVELSAPSALTATHIEDDGELIDAGDGTFTCVECGRNGYPIAAA